MRKQSSQSCNPVKDRRTVAEIARDYFQYLGTRFPQQCASDEFYFFPRSETAIRHLDRLDDLDPDRINDAVRCVRNLLRELPSEELDDLEEEVDRLLLKQSMA